MFWIAGSTGIIGVAIAGVAKSSCPAGGAGGAIGGGANTIFCIMFRLGSKILSEFISSISTFNAGALDLRVVTLLSSNSSTSLSSSGLKPTFVVILADSIKEQKS